MRRRVHRLLHVLACAPVAALMAVPMTPTLRAQAAELPRQQVVVLDAGHGGSPDNAHPEVPFDPGAVAANGLLEKDVALDLVRRIRTLLEQDGARVVLTRDADINVSIADRSRIANDNHADVFVSCHLNGFGDSTAEGSVVLYPSSSDKAFAQSMSDLLGRRLSRFGIQDDGTVLRDNWWIHVDAPVVTVESAYMSNPHDSEMLTRDDVRNQIAAAVRDGIEVEDPAILQRHARVDAGSHALVAAVGSRAQVAVPAPPLAAALHFPWLKLGVVAGLLGISVAAGRRRTSPAGLVRGRARARARAHRGNPLSRAPSRMPTLVLAADADVFGGRSSARGADARERRGRRAAILERARRPARTVSVYDELA